MATRTQHVRRRPRTWVAALLSLAFAAAPAPAADKKKDKDPTQSDAAKQALEKQKEIARQLKDKAANDPAVLQKQMDDLKARLDAEKSRHDGALAALQKDLTGFQAANDKKRVEKTQKAIDKENEASADKVADLTKQIADLQAKIDAAKTPAS